MKKQIVLDEAEYEALLDDLSAARKLADQRGSKLQSLQASNSKDVEARGHLEIENRRLKAELANAMKDRVCVVEPTEGTRQLCAELESRAAEVKLWKDKAVKLEKQLRETVKVESADKRIAQLEIAADMRKFKTLYEAEKAESASLKERLDKALRDIGLASCGWTDIRIKPEAAQAIKENVELRKERDALDKHVCLLSRRYDDLRSLILQIDDYARKITDKTQSVP